MQPFDGLINIERTWLEALFAAECEELAREIRGAFGGVRNFPQGRADLRIKMRPLKHHGSCGREQR